MHFVVSYEMKSEGERGLVGYPWIRLLSAFYILDIDAERDWQVIHERLLAVAQRYSGEVNFLMSLIYEFDSDYFVCQMPDKGFHQT